MNRRTFDLALIVVLLAKPAVGLLKMSARRWASEQSGTLSTVGQAVDVAL